MYRNESDLNQSRVVFTSPSKFVTGLVSLLAVVFLSFCAPAESQGTAPTVALVPVVSQPVFEVEISFNGSLVFPESSRESFSVPGTVQDVLVEEGDTVEQGQLLARLSESDLSRFSSVIDVQLVQTARARQQLDPDLPSSIADILQSADERYRDAIERWFGATLSDEDTLIDPSTLFDRWGLVDLETAFGQTGSDGGDDPTTPWNEVTLSTWRILYPGRVEVICEERNPEPSTFCIDDEINDAWVALKNARNQYEQQEIRVSSAEKNLAGAMRDFEDANLTAGTSGRIKEITLNEGDTVPEANRERFIDIENADIVEVVGAVQERDIGLVKEGQSVQVAVSAYPDTPLSGAVQRIAASSGSTFSVTVRLEPVDGLVLFEGMNGVARIAAASYENVLLIPVSALNGPISAPYVLVRSPGGTDTRTTVSVGESDGRMVIVESGLNEGDMVVVPATDIFTFPEDFGDGPGSRGPGGAPRPRGNS